MTYYSVAGILAQGFERVCLDENVRFDGACGEVSFGAFLDGKL